MADYPLTLLYDGTCPLCLLEMRRLMARNTSGRLAFVDIADPAADAKPYGLERDDLMRVIHAVKPDGTVLRGIDAIRLAYAGAGRVIVARLLTIPLIRNLATWVYPYIADNRYTLSRRFRWLIDLLADTPSCGSDMCDIDPRK